MSYNSKVGNIVETIYKKHDYILDEEVRNVLLDESQHKLLVAPAGGTKTTLTQLMVNLAKLETMVKGVQANMKIASARDRVATTISSSRILCLVYNKHNASDIDSVHAKFYNTLMGLKIISNSPAARNYVEGGVHATTLHSYSIKIIEENLALLKLRSFALAKDENIYFNFQKTVESVMKNSSVEVTNNLINDIKSLYDLYIGLKLYETPIDKPLTDDIQFEIKLQDTNVPSKYLREIFEKYDSKKKVLKIHEYSDMLRLADELLKIPEVHETYSNYFSIIVADEVQDFTPLMFSIYKRLVGQNTKTITVGDPDQSIYSFLGAAPNAINRFEDIMGIEVKRYNLTTNRRCRRETMPYALNVINAIPGRQSRNIVTNKQNGELVRLEYKNLQEHLKHIENVLKTRVTGNMGILFRTKNESILLSRFLYTRGIQANFINAFNCMQHRIYKLFVEILNECFISKSQKGLTLLHRLLPINKAAWDAFLAVDPKTKISTTCPTSQLWGNLDLTPLYKDSRKFFSINEQVEFIQDVAKNASSITASDCIPKMLDMFYWNFFAHLSEAKDDPFSEVILEWAKEDLAVGYNLRTAVENLDKNTKKFMSTGRKVGKLNVCTIHGTKGLEFNHVILNLSKDAKAELRQISAQARQFQDNEENRLMYVAATRQIDTLTVLCDMEEPHRLADESLFTLEQGVVLEQKYESLPPPTLISDDLLKAPSRPRGTARRSMLLED